ncbi:hypothetical protein AgCh_000296 [Apium graveolens]
MEVDGKICEIGGDAGGILVRQRDLREQKMGKSLNLNDKQTNEDRREEYNEFPSDNIVMDTKRKRVDNTESPPRIMSILSWNCRELANPRIVRLLLDIDQQYRPSLIFLSETLVKHDTVQKVTKQLGFAGCYAIDVQGHSGGIALLWRNDGAVHITNSCRNFIDFEVSNEQLGRWGYTGYYGFPERARRMEAWNMLRELSVASELPWCILGDFNDIVSLQEKRGGKQQPRRLMEGFWDAIMDSGLHDLGFTGDIFTWERSRGTDKWVQERLDRGMATQQWRNMFPLGEVTVLEDGERDLMEKIMSCSLKLEEWGGGLIREMKVQIGKYRKKCSITDLGEINLESKKLFSSVKDNMRLSPRIKFPIISDIQKEKMVTPIADEENGELPSGLNRTLVCLIPKVKHPKKVADLRPISLCNVLMRILSKVMANRLTPTQNAIISEKQSAFIEGRLLTDNALIAYEVNHYIRRKTQGKVGVVGLKGDISKAYDRLEWSFIEEMLQHFDFPTLWVDRVMNCVKSVITPIFGIFETLMNNVMLNKKTFHATLCRGSFIDLLGYN